MVLCENDFVRLIRKSCETKSEWFPTADYMEIVEIGNEILCSYNIGKRLIGTCKQCRVLVMRTSYAQFFVAAIVCIFFILVLCFKNLPPPVPHMRLQTGGPPGVTVLLWWYPFGSQCKMPDCAALYGVQGCRVTTNRSFYAGAEAVIIHHRDILGNVSRLPQNPRPPAQKWIWMNFESPSHTSNLEELEGIFNWTMSYKLGSDIFMPYGSLQRKKTSKPEKLPQKNKLLAWVISNWNEDHARIAFYWRLSRYINIDVYGRDAMSLVNDSVVQTVSRYKFYLAFENSQHPDYITEKLWHNALGSSAVPVVLGPSRWNYEKFLPGSAFIHVDDFSSPRMLAKYLKFLDRNPSAYRRYFSWKRTYQVHVTSFWNEHLCAVCTAARAARYQTKVVSDLAGWFNS
ncbi:4-galactosyl-N-acetylglucosaminide 3-alpha-L-fucosyltransferase 9-like [Brienomyrus brachyistius]|uniref:4-galactosyl-N-acetylglucosaminide 3-alpha-L-fucosyltransferase 9-like n=1 Tax=Brienomyrus brachyistius TaxID=42636 RepID=UPI0020B2479D|nr:4-galactosyl-N-acetylglucosaminide 3-alpha-L-fucosyltransferase 9-like [Brienomyrus brachyistius]